MEANRKSPSRLSVLFFPCLINDTGAAPDCRLPESQAQNKSDKLAGGKSILNTRSESLIVNTISESEINDVL